MESYTDIEPDLSGRIMLAEGSFFKSLVLVLANYSDNIHNVFVMLLSPDLELGADFDYLIGSNFTGLPYDLMVETDLYGEIPSCILKEVPSCKDAFISDIDFLDALKRAAPPIYGSHEYLPIGPPVHTDKDPRWDFKLHEWDRLQDLRRAHCAHV